MEFRKMVTITLYTRQQKRHWCIEQSFGLCGRRRGWDDLGEWHWNMYNIIYETSHQSRFDAWYWMLGAGTLGQPRGMVWRGRREEGSGWGTHVNLWRIHFNIWQNQYNIVKFKKKKKKTLLSNPSEADRTWGGFQVQRNFLFSRIWPNLHMQMILESLSLVRAELIRSFGGGGRCGAISLNWIKKLQLLKWSHMNSSTLEQTKSWLEA